MTLRLAEFIRVGLEPTSTRVLAKLSKRCLLSLERDRDLEFQLEWTKAFDGSWLSNASETDPPSAEIKERTASIPTPLPEISVSSLAVDIPESKMSSATASVVAL